MKLTKIATLVSVILGLGNVAIAQDDSKSGVEFGGWGFVRHEVKKNPNYIDNNNDDVDMTQMRVNVSAKKSLNDNFGYIYLAPQFSKIAGKTEFVGSSTTANSETVTSGTGDHSKIDMYEAFIALKPLQDEKTTLFIGRQQLAFGDELVLGSVGWSRSGRSFDGFRAQYNADSKWKVDALAMITNENDSSTTSSTTRKDSNLYGVYFNSTINDYLKNADLYVLAKSNPTGNSGDDITAAGFRLKSNLGKTNVDYRAETTFQDGKRNLAGNRQDQFQKQWDAEVGYTFDFYSTRLGAEVFYSSKDYDQFYPTGHKFLGFVDQFSRRNINGYVAHLTTKPSEKFTVNFDYHIFKRSDINVGVYDYTGTSLGTTGSNKDVATEFDLTFGYQLSSQLSLTAGYGHLTPDEYINNQGSTKNASVDWGFLQLTARI